MERVVLAPRIVTEPVVTAPSAPTQPGQIMPPGRH
jgi:hypothetical protein